MDTTDYSLDGKVTALMQALRTNNSDTWQDKPQEEVDISQLLRPTHDGAPALGNPKVVRAGTGSSDASGLDALMLQYVGHLKNLHQLDDEQKNSAPQPSTASTSAAAHSKDYDLLDTSDLLRELDALPTLKMKGPSE